MRCKQCQEVRLYTTRTEDSCEDITNLRPNVIIPLGITKGVSLIRVGKGTEVSTLCTVLCSLLHNNLYKIIPFHSRKAYLVLF